MNATISADPIPLPTRDEGAGGRRVGESRVLLELVLNALDDGASAEEIVLRYQTLSLADVYALLAHYPRYDRDIVSYRHRREQQAEIGNERILEAQADLTEIRARLLKPAKRE